MPERPRPAQRSRDIRRSPRWRRTACRRAEGREVERNDGFDTANRLDVGKSAGGSIEDRTDQDWFILPLAEDALAVELTLRNNGGACDVTAYSSDEQKLDGFVNEESNTATTQSVALTGSKAALVRVQSLYGQPCGYELFSRYGSG